MIKKENRLKRIFRSFALRSFYFLENNNNCDFNTNGEKLFIENLFKYLKKNLIHDAVIFDIGANIGAYSGMLLEISTQFMVAVKVHVFEPTRACFEILTDKYSGNEEVILNRSAASHRIGTARMFFETPKSGLASFYKRDLQSISGGMKLSEMVETTRLDRYIEVNHIDHIHFLKVDIEGHEMAAFEGMGSYLKSDFVDFVQFEYGGTNLDSHTSLKEFFRLFESSGFQLAKIMTEGLNLRSYQPWMDNFQYGNYVAISNHMVEKLR